MEFGRVENIDEVDFTLPPDHKATAQVLKAAKKLKGKPKVYVGCAKWGRPDWIGQIYPKGTKAADFLKLYATHFNSIELNALFYRLFPTTTIDKWASVADDNFRFCPKFTQNITHLRRLKNADRETDDFLKTVQHFGKKLGTSFIQLGDNYSPKQADAVYAYIEKLPKDFDVALELRHPDWFTGVMFEDTFSFLEKEKVTSIITDASGRRDVVHMRLTTPTAFIRYVGNGLHPTDYTRIDAWVKRVVKWLDNGLHTLYFFIHQHDELHSPILAKYLVDQLNKEGGLDLEPPHLIIEPPKPAKKK